MSTRKRLVHDSHYHDKPNQVSTLNDLTGEVLPHAFPREHLIEIEPCRCKPWIYHNRDIAWLTSTGCQDLISSIQKNGQIEPVLVRKTQGNFDYDWEIICGVRRWFSCSQIPSQKLLASVTTVDDKACTILMHAENAHSKDVSDFERAFSFMQQLKSGLFKNQTEMAQAFGISQGTISKLINAAKLFEQEWIRDLFLSKVDIPIKQAYYLSSLLSDPNSIRLVKEEATTVKEKQQNGYLPPSQVLKRLINKIKSTTPQQETIYLKVKDLPVITSVLNKFGKLFIRVEPTAKSLPFSQVESVLTQIIENYILKQSISRGI